MSTFTDSMPPGSVFVPQVIVERRWKYTRFLLILSAIIAATWLFTPYKYMSTWEFITLMAIASLTWVVAFLIRMLFLDRSYVVNDPRPPWFELTGETTGKFFVTIIQWFFIALLDGFVIVTSLRAEPINGTGLTFSVIVALIILVMLSQIVSGISPRFRATKLARALDILPN